MAQQNLNIGSTANDGTGDPLRVGAQKIQDNFNEVYAVTLVAYTKGNILGTVSQSAGVPTGAIIERGSNGNGEYVKFADGTLICTFVTTVDAASFTAGSIYCSPSDGSWTFPVAFATQPIVSGSLENTGSWLAIGSSNTATAGFSAWSYTVRSGTIGVRLMAVGRWF
jgi:hypothetical protein